MRPEPAGVTAPIASRGRPLLSAGRTAPIAGPADKPFYPSVVIVTPITLGVASASTFVGRDATSLREPTSRVRGPSPKVGPSKVGPTHERPQSAGVQVPQPEESNATSVGLIVTIEGPSLKSLAMISLKDPPVPERRSQ